MSECILLGIWEYGSCDSDKVAGYTETPILDDWRIDLACGLDSKVAEGCVKNE